VVEKADALGGEGIELRDQIEPREPALVAGRMGQVGALGAGMAAKDPLAESADHAELLGLLAERLHQAAHAGHRPEDPALRVLIFQAVKTLGEPTDPLARAVRSVQPPGLAKGQQDHGAGLPGREVPAQQLGSLDAGALGAQLAEQVVGDFHPQPMHGQRQHHQQTGHEDEPGAAHDLPAEPFPESAEGGRAGVGVLPRPLLLAGRAAGAANPQRPEDEAPAGAEHGRGQGEAGAQPHGQTQGDGRPAVAELAEAAEDHGPQPEDRGHGAGRHGAAHASERLGEGFGRRQAAEDFFLVASDEEQAEVGRRPEQDHDNEDPRGLEDLVVQPADRVAPLGDPCHQAQRHGQRDEDRHQGDDHQPRRAVDRQQDQHDQRDGRPLRVADALFGGEEHVGAHGRGAGQTELEAGGKVARPAHRVERLLNPAQQLHVGDRHELAAQLEDDEEGLAVGAHRADELLAHHLGLMAEHGEDRPPVLAGRREQFDQPVGDGQVGFLQGTAGAADNQDPLAAGKRLRERRFQQPLALDARHGLGQVGEVAVLGDVVPARGEPRDHDHQHGPGEHHQDPMPGNQRCEAIEHGVCGAIRPSGVAPW